MEGNFINNKMDIYIVDEAVHFSITITQLWFLQGTL